MDQLWYYEDHGRARGPVSTRELVNKIQKGEMTLMDLVFKEGQPQWLPAESFSEITELIGNISLQESADWIVLKTVNVDGKNIQEQIGPFNAQQILDLLDKGKIRFNDYVWRTGYEKWVPLGRVDEFEKPLKSSVEVDKSLYTKPRHFDLLQNDKKEAPLKKVTQVVVPVSAVQDEPMPEEAKGEDLAAPKWKVQTVISKKDLVDDTPKKVTETKTPQQEKKKPARRETAPLPPLPEAKLKEAGPKEADLPEQKYPIFDEPPVATESKRARVETETLRSTAKVETVNEITKTKPSVEKIKSKELPPLPSTSIPNSVEKIASAEIQENKKTIASEDKKHVIPIDSDLVAAQKEAANRRWMHVGAAACVVVIILSATLFVMLGKKRARTSAANDFSIKIDPPPAGAEKNTYKPAPAPRPVETPVETPPAVTETGVKPQPKSAAKSAHKKTPSAPVADKKENYNVSPTVGGSAKNRSYYHHKERIYLFYTSNEGEQLASDLQKASKNHQKSSKQWKTFYGGWKNKAKTYSIKVNKEAKKARLHRALFEQLMVSASDLEDLGRDVNSQITEGRSPSKVASAKNLESQFKNIGSSARNLDK